MVALCLVSLGGANVVDEGLQGLHVLFIYEFELVHEEI